MANILAWLKAWFNRKGWTTHTVWVSAVALAVTIASSKDLQGYITSLFAAHPVWASHIILMAIVIAKISLSNSPAGAVAHADAIMEGDNPPTATQVKAATTPPAAK
jgi:hypothetical protein